MTIKIRPAAAGMSASTWTSRSGYSDSSDMADIADRVCRQQSGLIGRGNRIATLLQESGRRQAADADQRHRQRSPLGGNRGDSRVGQQALSDGGSADQTGRGKEEGLRADSSASSLSSRFVCACAEDMPTPPCRYVRSRSRWS